MNRWMPIVVLIIFARCEVYRTGDLHYSRNDSYAKHHGNAAKDPLPEDHVGESALESAEIIDPLCNGSCSSPQTIGLNAEMNPITFVSESNYEPYKSEKQSAELVEIEHTTLKAEKPKSTKRNKSTGELPVNAFSILSLILFPLSFVFAPLAIYQISVKKRTRGTFFALFGFFLFLILLFIVIYGVAPGSFSGGFSLF